MEDKPNNIEKAAPKNPPIYDQQLRAIRNCDKNEDDCPFWKNGSCKKKKSRYCKCSEPIPPKKNNPYQEPFEICINCGHFIIFKKGKTWHHYNRAYQCGLPYSENECHAPKNLPLIKIDTEKKQIKFKKQ